MSHAKRRLEAARDAEITTDGRTVWVNSGEGWNIARFSPVRFEINGAPVEPFQQETLAHSRVTAPPNDWIRFKESVRENYGIEIADSYRPEYARE